MDTSSSSVAPIASFDGTLGALYISMVVGAVVYGTVCLQLFIYLTAKRTKEDGWWLRSFAMFLFVRTFYFQVLMFASMYKFLITGYQNLLVLVDSGAGSAQVLLYVSSILDIHIIFFCSFFFCWWTWNFTGMVLRRGYRILVLTVMVSLSMAAYVLVRSEFGVGELVTMVDDDIEILETVHQVLMFASMYKFLITGYQNLLVLVDSGAGSAQVLLYVSSILDIHIIFFCSFFFCWRTWNFTGMVLRRGYRILVLTIMVSLSMAAYVLVRSEFGVGEIVTMVDDDIEYRADLIDRQELNSRDYIQDKLGAEGTVQQNPSQMEGVTVSINDFIESKPVFAPLQGSGYNPSPILETFELRQSKISADFDTREARKRWSSWDSKNLSRGEVGERQGV
ncbi:hypothetical protein K435DRAFT_838832 [Dendrothele bispora CBS 962.96]|uniref:Uncharacterized protein n=1 Tax=Dendrothele bispora (strain CBS 962.96) TaxID=1314807 RepID=A0A4S8M3Z8_DENBC|nr:hypothetical protein K435DRAFT_838832 [Dendrothele bispora CBS 962.96]